MAEKRKHEASILLRREGETVRIELFPATEWAGQPGAGQGKYRVRVDGKWLAHDGKYRFLRPRAVAELIGGLLGGKTLPPRPDWPPGTRLSVPTGKTVGNEPVLTQAAVRSRRWTGSGTSWCTVTAFVGSCRAPSAFCGIGGGHEQGNGA